MANSWYVAMGRRKELTAEKVCWAGGQEDRKPTSEGRARGRERVRQPWERAEQGGELPHAEDAKHRKEAKSAAAQPKIRAREISW